jgi:DNA polymerase-3 subunit delta'
MDAECMHVAGANSLLKVLEEPPARSLFVLVSSAPEQLLPTIRSRCQRLSLQPLAADHVRNSLAAAGYQADRVELAVRLGGGDLHRAHAAARGELDEVRERVERFLAAAAAGDEAVYWALVTELGGRDGRADLELFVQILAVYLREFFLQAAGWEQGRLLEDDRGALAELQGLLGVRQVEAAAMQLESAAQMLRRNVNPSLLLVDVWRSLRASALPGAGVGGGRQWLAVAR